MDIHADIEKFLQANFPHIQAEGDYIKAGIVPFLCNPYRYYLMKPVAQNPALEPPKFQLCKGTRMVKLNNKWVDMRSGSEAGIKEMLAATALREAIEEIGLKLQNIKKLIDIGPYGFSSATTGKLKSMWLFAAEMASDDFSDDIAPITAERAWLTLKEFEVAGRGDHRYILRQIEEKLKE